jgi:hypothetical protein
MHKRIRAGCDLGHVQFFRTRLLISDSEQITKLVDGMEKESNSIRQEALQLCWYMRGGLAYDQALQLSVGERRIINEIVKGNLETTKKSGLPFF